MQRSPHQSPLQSVRGRLFLLIAALTVPPFAIIALLSWDAYRSQRATIRGELANTARAVASVVDREIDRCFAMLQTFAAARSLREKDWATLDDMARRVLSDQKRWLVVVDMTGKQIVNTRLGRGATIPPISLDPDYVAAMRAGQPFVSNMVFGPAAQQLVVHVGLPFRHHDGEIYGLSIVMEPDSLRETFDVQRFAPDGVLSVVDQDGRIIVRNPYKKEFIGGFATPDVVKVVREKKETVGESVTLERIPVLTAHSRAKCGWSVIIGVPKAKLAAPTQRLLFIGLGSSLVVALGAIGIATWIARVVVRNVDDLARDAERLARGEPAVVSTSHLQEINEIAQAMRRMAATKSEAQAQLREARDRLHDYAQQLERKVEERTASLRDAIVQMEEFSYTVSHDLRGPLRAMSAYATALLEDYGPSLDAQAREYLQRIVRASDRMSRLTSELLTYSRIVRADLQCSPIKLEPIVRGTIDQYAELSPNVADVSVITPLDDVMAHEVSLTQALTNLLTNAAKFVKRGQRPKITVRTERHGDRVRIWIEDQGIGIPRAQQDRLFRIFERAQGAVGYEGTGVGLAIVRKIVEKMGGSCGVESDGESGSRFWLELAAVPRDTSLAPVECEPATGREPST